MPNQTISRSLRPSEQIKMSIPASTSPANPSAGAARSNERYETTRDGLIVFFGTAKDVSEATELLAPLKSTCALMVRALEMTKAINDNKIALLEFVITLDTHSQYFKTFTDNIEQERLTKDFLLSALGPYKRELETLNEEALKAQKALKPGSMAPIIRRIGRSRIDVDQLRRWNDRLGTAHRLLTTSLQIHNSTQIAGASRDLKAIRQLVGDFSTSKLTSGIQGPLDRSIYGMDLDGCEPGTREDIITRIRQWGNDSTTTGKKIFWLSGPGGSGKTTVAVTMYKEWERRNCLGGRFFFSDDDMVTSTTQRFCVAVARDIAAHIPSLQPSIAAAIKDTPPAYLSLELQLQNMIMKPIEIYGGPVFIVVDGLDKVSNPQARHRLLGCLTKESVKVRNLRVLFSSSVLPDIEEVLGTPDLVERYTLNLPDSANGEIDPDITLYIEKHLKNLKEDTEDRKGKGTIASLSKGYFHWIVPAAFLLKRSRSGSELMEKLTTIDSANHLDGLYYLYLQRVVHNMWPANLKMDLLRILITVIQPISLASIHSFLPQSSYDMDGLRALVYQLRGLLKVGDSDIPIRVRHSSFRDFCVDPVRAREFHVDLAASHRVLALGCVKLLEPHLHYNILGIKLEGTVIPQNAQISNLDALLKARLSPAIEYASSHWPFHAALALQSPELLSTVKSFLNTQLLFWVELMSWRGHIEEAIEGLFYLQSAARPPTSDNEDLLGIDILVAQAVTFIRRNKVVVEHSALQVYCSALGLAIEDVAFLTHHREVYKCPSVVIQRRLSYETVPKVDGFSSLLEISHDGRLVATVGGDYVVELWMSSTGEPYKVRFEGHRSEVTSLAFSFDNQTLASGSKDGQLRFWSLTTGHQIQLIQTSGVVADVRFSPSSTYISIISIDISAERKSVLCLWKIPPITEGRPLSVQFTCKQPFTTAVFSSDSMLIAAVTEDGWFEIRSTSTGTLVCSGNAATSPLNVALSPGGERLAISDGLHIQLWEVRDLPTRVADMTITTIGKTHSLSISANGRYLLHGSTMWDIEANPPSLWNGIRLPVALQRFLKGPGSILCYEEGWICSAHPQGPLVEIPSYYNIDSGTPWRAYGSKVIFTPESGCLVLVDCLKLLS